MGFLGWMKDKINDDTIDDIEDVLMTEVSAHPLRHHQAAIAFAFRHGHLKQLETTSRLNYED